ncbi:hypothetical protein Taro_022992 [Colocasia esculenta]|uniref:Pentatricopeptide repeat-containing protein n=1 Tax=Colocasia esculenta TaxID=4460 RepID=A0A843V583_COLES|nr:hypothetical protein [Colocasia esculenta]
MRNVLSLRHGDVAALLSACGRAGHLRLGSSLHAAILKTAHHFGFGGHRDVILVWNSLVSMYAKCGELADAAKVLRRMEFRDAVSWNSIISGCLGKGELELAFRFFRQMQDLPEGARCDHATLTTLLSACVEPELLYACRMVHSVAITNGLGGITPVGNALVTAYYRCGCDSWAKKVFDEMPEKNVITWTAAVSGLARCESFEDSLLLFREMIRTSVDANSMTYSSCLTACSGLRALREGCIIHGRVVKTGHVADLCLESALMDMYSKCGAIEDARRIFESAEELDGVSYTVMLVGFAQNGMEEQAFNLFVRIVKSGIHVDPNMISAILGAFGDSASLSLGKQIHASVIKTCFGSNLFVGNGLINMYSKCGELGDAVEAFSQMVQRNLVSWNSVIAALARHGQGSEALQFYESMKLEGIKPTDVTFLSLLHACSHVGSIEKGMDFLRAMSEVHGINPRVEHYACVVDMMGRAGRLEEAKSFIEGLPLEPTYVLWQSLLGACGIQGNSEMGAYAAQRLLLVAPESPAAYVLMANIYCAEERWEDRARVIKKMKEMGVKKEPGMSWIEVGRDVHIFVVGNRHHPQSEDIYDVLELLTSAICEESYIPD